VYVATPPLKVPVPRVVAPSLKVTVPVGVPEPGETAATVAVKVTDCPTTLGFALDVRVVMLPAWLTTCETALEVEVEKFVSPPYTPVMLWVPSARAEVVYVATPALNVPVPRVVAPSLKVTVPVGVPEPGETAATVAVKVTDCPKTLGFTLETTLVVLLDWLTTCETALEVEVEKFVSPP